MRKSLVLAFALFAVPLFAQQSAMPSRLAVVDVDKVLFASSAGKAAFERLQKLQEDLRSKMEKMQEEMKSLREKRAAASANEAASLERQLADKQTAAQRFAEDAERQMTAAKQKAMEDLNRKIQPLVIAIGKEMNLAVIFNKFQSGLVYAGDSVDITDIVVKRMNDAPAVQTEATPAPKATPKPAAKPH